MRREIASNARAKWMAVCTVALAAACANSNPGGEESTSTQGLALKMEIGAKTGITGMHFVVQAVDCASGEALPGSDPISTDKALDELMLPGGTPELMDNPLDKASTHAFADAFFTLAAGCYDVTTTPATTAGMVCHSAMKSKVAVTAGKTTEIFLLNQCDGKDPGALDVIAATNHPPVLLDVSFKTSKFVKTCADQVVCATAQDPENDKLEFVWTKDASGPAIQGPFAEGTTKVNADGSLTQCVRFVPQAAGMVSLTATVYDVAHNSAGTVRIEDWLAAEGYPNPSHASLSLPSYSTGDMAPATEICTDGIDNDCDGLADAEDVDDCYTGIPDDGCPPGLVPVCDKSPLDIALLQDLTGSFGDDIVTLRSLAPNLVAALNAASTDVRLGDVSFRDKPYAPFGDAGDYVYQPRLALETPGAGFVSVINSLVTGGGYDTSEAQLSALCLTAENATGPTIGFRSDAAVKRFAILVTDAPFHLAPDCVTMAYSPVCTGPYVADGVDDPSEDYPTQDQAIAVLNAANITPVFAVTSWTTSYYQGLVDALGRGKVVTLASDSSNIMDAIFAGLGTECTCKAP